MAAAVLERLLAKTAQQSDGCWVWQAQLDSRGYGRIKSDGKPRFAHRVAYEQLVGPIPDGLELDHLCRVTSCVNPAHMEPVTHRVNMLRGVNQVARYAVTTVCVEGHPLTGPNLYVTPDGRRQCKSCRAAAWQRYVARKKAI